MQNIPSENTKLCQHCGKLIYNTFRKLEWSRKKFCSRECRHLADRGRKPWNKGKTGWMSEEGRRKVGESTRRTLKNQTREQVMDRINKMVKHRKEHDNFKGTLGRVGELSAPWLGEKANYNSKHKWIQKHWTKTGICENCGLSPKLFGNRKYGTEWHNKDRKYSRVDRGTWLELCSKCHKKEDKLWQQEENKI